MPYIGQLQDHGFILNIIIIIIIIIVIVII